MAYVLHTRGKKTFVINADLACQPEDIAKTLCRFSHIPEAEYQDHKLYPSEQTALTAAQDGGDLTGIFDWQAV